MVLAAGCAGAETDLHADSPQRESIATTSVTAEPATAPVSTSLAAVATTTPPSTVPLSPTEPAATREEHYVSTMRALAAESNHGETWVERLDDEGLVRFGMNDCEALDRGSHPWNLMQSNIAAAGAFDPWSQDETLYHQSIYVASGSLCPHHEEAVHAFYDNGLQLPGAYLDFGGMADNVQIIWMLRSEPPKPDYPLFYDVYESLVADSDLTAELLSQRDAQSAADQMCDRLTNLEPTPDVVTATKEVVIDLAQASSIGNQHALILTVAAVGGVCSEDTYASSHKVIEAIGYGESHRIAPEQSTDH